MRRRNVSALTVLALGACSKVAAPDHARSQPGAAVDVVEEVGCYACCFEMNHFIADRNNPPSWNHHDQPERWEVVSAPEAFSKQFYSLSKGSRHGTFAFEVAVKVRGTLGPIGSFGHMGLSRRQLTITSFSEMQPTEYPRCHSEPPVITFDPPPAAGK